MEFPADLLVEISHHLGAARIFLRPICRETARRIPIVEKCCFIEAYFTYGMLHDFARQVSRSNASSPETEWRREDTICEIAITYTLDCYPEYIFEAARDRLIPPGMFIFYTLTQWDASVLNKSSIGKFLRIHANLTGPERTYSTYWLLYAWHCTCTCNTYNTCNADYTHCVIEFLLSTMEPMGNINLSRRIGSEMPTRVLRDIKNKFAGTLLNSYTMLEGAIGQPPWSVYYLRSLSEIFTDPGELELIREKCQSIL